MKWWRYGLERERVPELTNERDRNKPQGEITLDAQLFEPLKRWSGEITHDQNHLSREFDIGFKTHVIRRR